MSALVFMALAANCDDARATAKLPDRVRVARLENFMTRSSEDDLESIMHRQTK